MLHGEQRDAFDLSFAVPSLCADRLAEGTADIGIVPVVEIPRQRLDVAPGTGIACDGDVRSILLISKVPVANIRTVATDTSSRTSVQLTRVILERKYGVRPKLTAMPADLALMLRAADAALLIGDAALYIDPAALPFEVLDLGGEWKAMTGLPFVFAAWAGLPGTIDEEITSHFARSCRFGLSHLDEIVVQESARRGMAESLVHDYLAHQMVFELGHREYEGMRLFLEYAGYTDSVNITGAISV